MTPPPLEDHLNRLADGLIAPPTPEARQAIGHRTGVLRRRRRARQAAGVGVLVLVAVAGSIAVTRDTTPDTQTDFADPHGAALPALTLDAEGWDVVSAQDTVAEAPVATTDGTIQVFHRPGDAEGPSIVLRHWAASDPTVPRAGADEEQVALDAATGFLDQLDSDEFVLRWTPALGDNGAEIEARGLSHDEVLAFANGLQGRDDEFGYPPALGDRFGFEATYLPPGFEEGAMSDSADEPAPARRLVAESASARAEIAIEASGDAAYWATVDDLQSAGPAEQLTVMGHPAFLAGSPDELGWTVVWQPRGATTARITVSGVDRGEIDKVVAGLREIGDDEWDTLVTAQSVP
jgi:hypothetical protein